MCMCMYVYVNMCMMCIYTHRTHTPLTTYPYHIPNTAYKYPYPLLHSPLPLFLLEAATASVRVCRPSICDHAAATRDRWSISLVTITLGPVRFEGNTSTGRVHLAEQRVGEANSICACRNLDAIGTATTRGDCHITTLISTRAVTTIA